MLDCEEPLEKTKSKTHSTPTTNFSGAVQSMVIRRLLLVSPILLCGRCLLLSSWLSRLLVVCIPLALFLSYCFNGSCGTVSVFTSRMSRIGVVSMLVHQLAPAILFGFLDSELGGSVCKDAFILLLHRAKYP